MVQNRLALLISLIKLGLSRNRLNIKAPYSKLNVNVLQILYHEGYIRGFKVTNQQQSIHVYLKISENRNIFKDLVYFSPSNRKNYISYKGLMLMFGLKNFAIISTSFGLLTLEQCFLRKTGGKLVLLLIN